MCGDSTNPEHVRALMDGQRAKLLATDPPYLVDYDGTNHPQSKMNQAEQRNNNKKWDDYIDPDNGQEFYEAFITVAYAEAVEESVPVYQWHADKRRCIVEAAWLNTCLLPHQTIIWVKNRPILGRTDFMFQSEPCLVGHRKPDKTQKDAAKTFESCLYGWRKGDRPTSDRRPPADTRNVWELDTKSRNDIHPTEKPVELFARPHRWHLKPNEIAYEPFSGSGSQIIAAEMESTRCYAMELSPTYVDAAARRFQEFTGILPIDASTGEPHDFTT